MWSEYFHGGFGGVHKTACVGGGDGKGIRVGHIGEDASCTACRGCREICCCLKKIPNASKPPEHSPSGGMSKDLGGNIVLAVGTKTFRGIERVPQW